MDLLILGGGPAGVAAALRARELGADVTLLESKRIGGISANGGPARGIELIEGAGPARLLDSYRVGIADGRTCQADSIILAVGGHGRKLPIPGAELALTHSDIWSLRHLPARVAVIGGSDTGCQLASIFEDFGWSNHRSRRSAVPC